MRRWLVSLVLVVALVGPAEAGRPRWLGGTGRPTPARPARYVSPPLVQPGQRSPEVHLGEAHQIASNVYRGSNGLRRLSALSARVGTMRPKDVRHELDTIAADIEATYGLRVRFVSDKFRHPRITDARGSNPAAWLDAEGVILIRGNLPPAKLVKELAHEYGAFQLARTLGGRGRIPNVGESGFATTHILDGIVRESGGADPRPFPQFGAP